MCTFTFIPFPLAEKNAQEQEAIPRCCLWIMGFHLILGDQWQVYRVEWYGTNTHAKQLLPFLLPFIRIAFYNQLPVLDISRYEFKLKPNLEFANIFLILWFLCGSFYFIVSPLRRDIGVMPMTIMAAVAILTVLNSQKGRLLRILPAVYIVILILSVIFTGFVHANTSAAQRQLKISVADSVGQYIREHTLPDDEIFTGTAVFAVKANRHIIFDISHPAPYESGIDDPWAGYDPHDVTQSITEIINYLEQNKIIYIVADNRTKSIFLSDGHPELRDYVFENYMIEKSEYNVDIYVREKS